MRLTWLVLGVVVAAGAVAFINTDEDDPQHPPAKDGPAKPALNRSKGASAPAAADLDLTEAQVEAENRARKLLKQIQVARAEGGKNVAKLVDQLKRTAWDTPSARRYAYLEGRRLLREAGNARNKATIAKKDEARRLLSRVLYLPEMFTKRGASTDERTKLIQTIQKLNRQVMRYGPGVAGVTLPYEVPPGLVPVQIVSRQKLPMGCERHPLLEPGRQPGSEASALGADAAAPARGADGARLPALPAHGPLHRRLVREGVPCRRGQGGDADAHG